MDQEGSNKQREYLIPAIQERLVTGILGARVISFLFHLKTLALLV